MKSFISQQLSKSFTDEEKEGCITVIRRIVELSNLWKMANTEDASCLESFEREIFTKEGLFFKVVFSLVIDGVDSEFIEKISENLTIIGDYSGRPLLERLLMMEGVLAIQRRDNPLLIIINSLSMLGEEYVGRIGEIFPNYSHLHLS